MLIAPFFVDWTAYRADFEREASRILGRPVVVRGEASARMLPFPSVTFKDVVVEGEAGSGQSLLTIDGFRMDAELAPYLSGEVRIFSMRLDHPQMRLPVGADGAVGWLGKDAALPTNATVVLEDVAVANGSLTLENRLSGRVETLTDIEATLSAQSLTGPFSGSGTLRAAGKPVSFLLSSGVRQPEGRLPLKLTVDSSTLNASMVFDGAARFEAGVPEFGGTLRLVSPLPPPPGLGPLADAQGGREAAAAATDPLPPLTLTSALTATPKSVALSEMRVAAGEGEAPYILTGAGTIGLARQPSFTLSLEGEQVDVDKMAADEKRPHAAVTFEQRLEAAREVFSAVPRPPIPGVFRITLPVVVAGDTTIRDVAFAAAPTATGWSVERFAAELPGRTRMTAAGIVGLEDALTFKGDLLVASRQPSGFADWLTGAVDPAVRALTQAGFSAKVDLSPNAQVFDDLEVDVGGDVLKGRLERSGPRQTRQMKAAVSAGRVDLDALSALTRLFTGDEDSVAEAERFSVRFDAGPVSFKGAAAQRIDADLSYDGDRLHVERLDIHDLAGADLTAAGDLGGLPDAPEGRLDVGLKAARPAELIDFLQARLPPGPVLETLQAKGALLGPLAVTGTVVTVPGAPGEGPMMRVDLGGSAAGTELALNLLLGNGIYAGGPNGRFGLDLSLSNTAPSVLLGQLGLATLPVKTPSPLSLQVSLSAETTGPVTAKAALRAPGSEIDAEGTLAVAADGFTGLDLGLAARSADLAPWLLAAGAGFGLAPDAALPVDVAGRLASQKGDWTLKAVTGEVGGTSISADLEKPAGRTLTGAAFASDLSAPWLASLVYGRRPVSRAGMVWPDESFGTPVLPPFDYVIDFTADRLRLNDAESVSDLGARLHGNATEAGLDGITGAVAGGYVTGSLSMKNANGVGGFAMKADFTGTDLGALALGSDDALAGKAADGVAPAPAPGIAGTMDAGIAIDGTGQSFAALVTALRGAASVSVENLSFAGIRPGMFAKLLAAADREGFTPSGEATGAILRTLARDARYLVPSGKAEASIAGGVVRFAPASAAGAGERLSGDGSIDLRTMSVAADLRLDLDPGDEAVKGAEPSILYRLAGPLAAPTLVPDPQPMASYLSVRAFEREQARVEALQDQLQERLRLRREVRYYRWREAQRLAAAEAEAAAAEAERLRLDRLNQEADQRRQAEEAARAEADRRAAEQTAADAAAAEQAAAAEAEERDRAARTLRARKAEADRVRREKRLAAEAAARTRSRNSAPDATPPDEPLQEPDFRNPAPFELEPEAPPSDFPSLPGVSDPTLISPAAPPQG